MDSEIEKIKTEIAFEWVDSNTYVTNENGNLVPAGTCLLINSTIIVLTPLSDDHLVELKRIVNEAVDHELAKRKV